MTTAALALTVVMAFVSGMGLGGLILWHAITHPNGIFGRMLEDKDDTRHGS